MKSHLNLKIVLERKSFPKFLQALNYHVDIKEWSETGGVFSLCRKILHNFAPDDVYDIGCGKRPTLALLMALNYPFNVHAVDPQLDTSYAKAVSRLFLYNLGLRNFAAAGMPGSNKAMVLANHAHVPAKDMSSFLSGFKEWVYVTVPCCIDNRLASMPCVHYKDPHMHSEKNGVYVYSNVKPLLANLVS